MTSPSNQYLSNADNVLSNKFVRDGYIINLVEDLHQLDKIREFVENLGRDHLGKERLKGETDFFNLTHQHLAVSELNELRLSVINGLRAADWFKPAYYALAREAIHAIVGNELAMQRGINLSIQIPNDDSSLLPMHADVLNGDSCFEVVLWVPLVDCYRTKSMYILSPERTSAIFNDFKKYDGQTADVIFETIKPHIEWLEVPYGSYLLFSQNLLHGNLVNEEPETRWSMNCRFKSLLSPYADKKFGEFFEPITMRAATRIGLKFKEPSLDDV